MTLAVIKTGGKQYIVSEGQKFKIEKLNQNEGDEFEFDKVLLFANIDSSRQPVSPEGTPRGRLEPSTSNGQEIKIGQPYLDGIKVRAKVLKQGRGEKKIVFRFMHKTRYKKKKGHRQFFTEVEILSIS